MRRVFSVFSISLLLILLHTTLVNVVTVGTAVPDVLLIWVVYLAIQFGQLAGTILGFSIGLFIDLLSGNDGMVGLAALSKSLAGFLAGYFYQENKTEQTLSSARFVVAVGLAALLHNAIYFVIFLYGSDVGWWRAIAWHGIPSTLYTTALSIVPMSLFRRRYQ